MPMKFVQGKGASAGVAAGPILVKPAGRKPELRLDTCLDPQQELKRFQAAQQQALQTLETLKEKAREQVGKKKPGSLKSIS